VPPHDCYAGRGPRLVPTLWLLAACSDSTVNCCNGRRAWPVRGPCRAGRRCPSTPRVGPRREHHPHRAGRAERGRRKRPRVRGEREPGLAGLRRIRPEPPRPDRVTHPLSGRNCVRRLRRSVGGPGVRTPVRSDRMPQYRYTVAFTVSRGKASWERRHRPQEQHQANHRRLCQRSSAFCTRACWPAIRSPRQNWPRRISGHWWPGSNAPIPASIPTSSRLLPSMRFSPPPSTPSATTRRGAPWERTSGSRRGATC
jgi:hypothetical protein